MTISEKQLKMPYATAARDRAADGGTVFIWRALVPAKEKHQMTGLADTIEAIEYHGWRLEQALPAGMDSPFQAAWVLIFRRVEG